MAYLSRRYLGLEVSVSGIGMRFPSRRFGRYDNPNEAVANRTPGAFRRPACEGRYAAADRVRPHGPLRLRHGPGRSGAVARRCRPHGGTRRDLPAADLGRRRDRDSRHDRRRRDRSGRAQARPPPHVDRRGAPALQRRSPALLAAVRLRASGLSLERLPGDDQHHPLPRPRWRLEGSGLPRRHGGRARQPALAGSADRSPRPQRLSRYCCSIFDCWMMSCHIGTSLATRAARPFGPAARTSKPTSRSLAVTSGSFSTASVSAETRWTIASGVPAGAYMPWKVSETISGKPDSIMVGTSGRSNQRRSTVRANARSAPDLMCGWAGGSAVVPSGVVLARIAWIAGPAPLS